MVQDDAEHAVVRDSRLGSVPKPVLSRIWTLRDLPWKKDRRHQYFWQTNRYDTCERWILRNLPFGVNAVIGRNPALQPESEKDRHSTSLDVGTPNYLLRINSDLTHFNLHVWISRKLGT